MTLTASCQMALVPYASASPEREATRQCGYTRRTCDRTARAYAQDHVQIQPVDTTRQFVLARWPNHLFFSLSLRSNPLDSREK